MKIRFLILISSLVLMIDFTFGQDGNLKDFISEAYGISISIPSEWEIITESEKELEIRSSNIHRIGIEFNRNFSIKNIKKYLSTPITFDSILYLNPIGRLEKLGNNSYGRFFSRTYDNQKIYILVKNGPENQNVILASDGSNVSRNVSKINALNLFDRIDFFPIEKTPISNVNVTLSVNDFKNSYLVQQPHMAFIDTSGKPIGVWPTNSNSFSIYMVQKDWDDYKDIPLDSLLTSSTLILKDGIAPKGIESKIDSSFWGKVVKEALLFSGKKEIVFDEVKTYFINQDEEYFEQIIGVYTKAFNMNEDTSYIDGEVSILRPLFNKSKILYWYIPSDIPKSYEILGNLWQSYSNLCSILLFQAENVEIGNVFSAVALKEINRLNNLGDSFTTEDFHFEILTYDLMILNHNLGRSSIRNFTQNYPETYSLTTKLFKESIAYMRDELYAPIDKTKLTKEGIEYCWGLNKIFKAYPKFYHALAGQGSR